MTDNTESMPQEIWARKTASGGRWDKTKCYREHNTVEDHYTLTSKYKADLDRQLKISERAIASAEALPRLLEQALERIAKRDKRTEQLKAALRTYFETDDPVGLSQDVDFNVRVNDLLTDGGA